MKAKILAKALDLILENPQWRKKLKTIAIVGIIGLLLTGGLVIWAGVSAANYVAREMGQHMGPAIAATKELTTELTAEATGRVAESAEAPISQETVLKGVASGVGVVASVERCWTNVQGIIESERLVSESLTGGISGMIMSIKSACLGFAKPELPQKPKTSEEVI